MISFKRMICKLLGHNWLLEEPFDYSKTDRNCFYYKLPYPVHSGICQRCKEHKRDYHFKFVETGFVKYADEK